jgi:hypothetical protein
MNYLQYQFLLSMFFTVYMCVAVVVYDGKIHIYSKVYVRIRIPVLHAYTVFAGINGKK